MKKYFPVAKKQFSTLALGCALVALAALALINCTDPTPPATFTVKFDTNGGIPAVKNKTVEAGKLLAKPTPEPSKEGYTFVGWYKDEEFAKAFDFNTEKITDNITLYAKWIINSYTVTFNLNGGTPAVADKTVEAGKLLAKPTPEPSKEGYTFVGWYKDEEFAKAFDFNTEKITDNITLYAKWTINSYTVTFNLNGGTPNEEDKTVAHGERVQQPSPDPTKTDSLFAGWFKDEKLTQAFDFGADSITANTDLYAKWESHLVTIPDAKFRAKLQALIPGAFVGEQLDATSDEVTGRISLDVNLSGIRDLAGIRYFTDLEKLDCSNNINISTGLDVSSNTKLVILRVNGNNLTGLDVSKNAKLTQLHCRFNSLTDLDVSNNTQLTTLYCDGNRLTDLDVFKNKKLTVLNCGDNSLTDLDVSTNTQLTTLFCDGNRLSHLDMRGMRSIGYALSVQESTNIIDTLKVHVNLKDHKQIKKVKTARGDEVKIETYSAAEGSTVYTATCNDYDPTEADEQGRCKDTP